MTNMHLLQAMGHIDPALIAEAAPDVPHKKNTNKTWVKWGAIAACLSLIVSAVMVIPLLNAPTNDVPPISTMSSGINITGKQEVVYGNTTPDSQGDADMIAPGFEIQTVIEAEIIEVLPDTYYNAALYNLPLHIAKLRIVDQIRGDGLPEEIYLCYPYYDTNIFTGYERFIMSLE